MLKNRFRRGILIIAFIICGILFFAFASDDYFNSGLPSNEIKATYICAIFALILTLFLFDTLFDKSGESFLPNLFLVLATGLTVAADMFLIFNIHPIIGVIIFIVAQVAHTTRLFILAHKEFRYLVFSIAARLLLGTITLLILHINGQNDPITTLAGYYAVNLIMNFIEPTILIFFNKEKRLQLILISGAFFLFIGCDLFVGLNFLGISNAYRPIWSFYAPCQFLFFLSAYFSSSLESNNA